MKNKVAPSTAAQVAALAYRHAIHTLLGYIELVTRIGNLDGSSGERLSVHLSTMSLHSLQVSKVDTASGACHFCKDVRSILDLRRRNQQLQTV